jgi:hypothetical protein
VRLEGPKIDQRRKAIEWTSQIPEVVPSHSGIYKLLLPGTEIGEGDDSIAVGVWGPYPTVDLGVRKPNMPGESIEEHAANEDLHFAWIRSAMSQ